MITQVTLGKTYEVCCPGTSDSVGDIQYCCVGGKNENNKKRDVCFPFCYSSGSDATTTSSCTTKVPITAADFSGRVASGTKTAAMASAMTTAITTSTDNASAASSTSPSQTGSAQVVTAAPVLVGFGLVVAMNSVLLLGL